MPWFILYLGWVIASKIYQNLTEQHAYYPQAYNDLTSRVRSNIIIPSNLFSLSQKHIIPRCYYCYTFISYKRHWVHAQRGL